jgi:hypothetical protein
VSGTQGTGFTLLTTQDGNVGEYRIPAGTGTQALSFTEAASNDFAVFGAEFLASAAAAGIPDLVMAPMR